MDGLHGDDARLHLADVQQQMSMHYIHDHGLHHMSNGDGMDDDHGLHHMSNGDGMDDEHDNGANGGGVGMDGDVTNDPGNVSDGHGAMVQASDNNQPTDFHEPVRRSTYQQRPCASSSSRRASVSERPTWMDAPPAWMDAPPAWMGAPPAWIGAPPEWMTQRPAWMDEPPTWVTELMQRMDALETRFNEDKAERRENARILRDIYHKQFGRPFDPNFYPYPPPPPPMG